MGDTSQNIFYDSGMNDWRELREEIFAPGRDRFYTLAKSYRNTVEISQYAGRVLEKCSFETYKIDPILRHGIPVETKEAADREEMTAYTADCIRQIEARGYKTIAVICRTEEEAWNAEEALCEGVSDPEGSGGLYQWCDGTTPFIRPRDWNLMRRFFGTRMSRHTP